MAKPRTIGNMIAPGRIILLVAILIAGSIVAAVGMHSISLGIMAGFDVAAIVFLASCATVLRTREEASIRRHAAENDANRVGLLVITAIVVTVLLLAIAAEAVGRNPQPLTKILIIATLVLAWLFSNMIYAFHYAHMAYMSRGPDCDGFDFPGTAKPVYWDFVYFAFTCGMAFATSDVQITQERVRKVVTAHCLAAFVFNIGALAFTINVLASGA
jgi:uncharacterized membrane protein